MFTEDFPWYPFFTFLSFAWGAATGSFLNVCIYRIPRDESVVKPRSHCPHCNTLIPWYLNIPIFTYIMLWGRCRFCKARITPRYVLVELLVAFLFLLVWLKFDLTMGPRPLGLIPIISAGLVPVLWLYVSGLVLATFVDFEHMIIPDSVSIGGMIVGVILSAVVPAMHGVETLLESVIQSGIGCGGIGHPLAVIAWRRHRRCLRRRRHRLRVISLADGGNRTSWSDPVVRVSVRKSALPLQPRQWPR